ncbi:MAG: D-alanyl-D-alanine carboxypeptidase/D-alanyl-D-alanine-endopeptidase [Verrucomicrobiota bacterium]
MPGASRCSGRQARNFLAPLGSALPRGWIGPSLTRVIATLLACFLLLVLGLGGPLRGAEAAAPSTLAELQERLERRLRDERFRGGLWGVQVVSLTSGRVWFEHEPGRLMSPASNSKLFAGALALDVLGPEYRIRTPVQASAAPLAGGALPGDLFIAGRGDPSWRTRGTGRPFSATFAPVVEILRRAGVRRIAGDLIADATWFHQPPQGSGWTVDDLNDWYGAELCGVTLEQNYAELSLTPAPAPGGEVTFAWRQPDTGLEVLSRLRTGAVDTPGQVVVRRLAGESRVHLWGTLPAGGRPELVNVTIPRPAEWYAAALRSALAREGIVVEGRARAARWPDPSPIPVAAVQLGELVSPPIRVLVAEFMKPSQNLETDLVFGHLGELRREAGTPSHRTGEALALEALREFLLRAGIDPADVRFEEGSGLSRNNLLTARATVALLAAMARHPAGKDFEASLPVAGRDGTLRSRLRGTAAEGNVSAKTGTLRWANALSGYLHTAGGERLAFALLLNRHAPSPGAPSAREELDQLVTLLAAYAGPG